MLTAPGLQISPSMLTCPYSYHCTQLLSRLANSYLNFIKKVLYLFITFGLTTLNDTRVFLRTTLCVPAGFKGTSPHVPVVGSADDPLVVEADAAHQLFVPLQHTQTRAALDVP